MKKEYFEELTADIKNAYESSPTIEEAEKLAAKFLHAQLLVSSELKMLDLDARMKKSGNKAIRAVVYLNEVKQADKKPSDTMLQMIVDDSQIARDAQDELDVAEVKRNEYENYLSVFKEAHIFFRGIAKGRFD